MSQLDASTRLYPTFSLWDVRDVEAHVRTTLNAALKQHGDARLKPAVYEKFLVHLVELCWHPLSGINEDRTPRLDHYAEIIVGRDKATSLGPFRSEERAQEAVAAWRERNLPAGAFSFVGYRAQRPAGAYDPGRGLAFSTYSRRIITLRVVDRFREHLGDSRYKGKPQLVSLDQLLDDSESRTILDVYGPGTRDEVLDELNRHAYYDPFEERDALSTIDPGGTERVAAAG